MQKVGRSISSRVRSKTENFTPVAPLVNIDHLRARAGLVGPVSVYCDWVEYPVNLLHCISVCWQYLRSDGIHLNNEFIQHVMLN